MRRLALNDEQSVRLALDTGSLSLATSHLDPKTHALMRLGALLSVDGPAASCRWSVELARDAGATEEEIVGILWAIGPVVGLARIVAAAPKLGLAIGYDVEAAFEEPAG